MSQSNSISDQKYQESPSFLPSVELIYPSEEYAHNFLIILIVRLFYPIVALLFLKATFSISRSSKE